MDLLDKKERLCSLYDLYKNLLTDTQRRYFEDYYFMDLSLSEVSSNYDVSRNAIYDQIKRIGTELEDFEEKLKLKEKEDNLNAVLKEYEEKQIALDLIKKIRDLE